jgi:hypothetical protein
VFETCLSVSRLLFTGKGPDGMDGNGNGNGNRLYDADSGWTDADRSLVCWFGRFGLMVRWSGIWFGLVSRFFGFSTGAGGFIFLVLSIRRFDAASSGIGLDFSCTYTRLRSLAFFFIG